MVNSSSLWSICSFPVTVVLPSGYLGCSQWFFRGLDSLAWRFSVTQMDVTCCPCPVAQFTFTEVFVQKKVLGYLLLLFIFLFTFSAFCPVSSSPQRVSNFLISPSCQSVFLIACFLQVSFKCLLWWNPGFCLHSPWFPRLFSSVTVFSSLYSWFTFPLSSL